MGVTSAWTTLMALALGTGCTGPGEEAPPPQAGAGGSGGSQPTTSAASTTGAGAGGGGTPYVCDPPAEPGSIWERTAESLSVDEVYPVPMCKYRGDVLFIVNTAAV
jgi:hypothetical protein